MAANHDSSGSSVILDNKPFSLNSLTLEQIREIGEVLQTAIYSGKIDQSKQIAARLASERIKLDIKVDENSLGGSVNDVFSLSVVVEDRESGSSRPIKLKVTAKDTIKDLKYKFFMNYQFPVEVQKWIIDKKLPLDGDTLNQHKIRGPGHTAYVYIMTAKSVNLTEYNYQQQLNTRMPQPQPGKSLTMPRSHGVISGEYVPMSTPVKRRSFSFKSKPDLPNNIYVNSSMTVSPTALEDIMASESSLNAYESIETVNCLRYQDSTTGSLVRNSSLSQNGPPNLPKPATIIKSPEILKPIGWTCPQCTYINIPTRPGCEMCSEDRPIDYTIPTEYVLSNEERERIEQEQEIERRMQEGVLTESVDSATQQGLSERELDLMLKFNDAIQMHQTDQDSYDIDDDYDVIPPSPIITKSFGDRTS